MNAIEQAIARERHNCDLWRDIKPEEAARSEVRIHSLQDELAAVRLEENETLVRFERDTTPRPQPTPVLNPLGMDEFVEGPWIVDQETYARRPR